MRLSKILNKNRPIIYKGDDFNSLGNIKDYIYNVVDNVHKKGNYPLNVYSIYNNTAEKFVFRTGYDYSGYTLYSDGIEYYLITNVFNYDYSSVFYFKARLNLMKLGNIYFDNYKDNIDIDVQIFREASELFHRLEWGICIIEC